MIYAVADLGTVWVDLNVHRKYSDKLKIGEVVNIFADDGLANATGQVSYISRFGAETRRRCWRRVELPNPTGAWRPGTVRHRRNHRGGIGSASGGEGERAPELRDWDVVFMQDGGMFEIAILELGAATAKWVEFCRFAGRPEIRRRETVSHQS